MRNSSKAAETADVQSRAHELGRVNNSEMKETAHGSDLEQQTRLVPDFLL